MKTVYLVRHGESEINNQNSATILGDESPLTKRGIEQAEVLALRCAKLPLDAFIASPIARTRETADIIARRVTIPIEFSDEFIERQIPLEFVGKARESIFDSLQRWSESFFIHSPTFEELRDRACRALRVLESHAGSHILVVTHGFFMRTMLARVIFGDSLTPAELRKWIRATRTDNSGITVLTHDAAPKHDVDPGEIRWKIRVYNDHAHLG